MIWIIGGTKDAIKISESLKKAGFSLKLSTSSSYAAYLAQQQNIPVLQGKRTIDQYIELFKSTKCHVVIDASHSFDDKLSKNLIEVCRLLEIRYIRFERKPLVVKGVQYYETVHKLAKTLEKESGNIMLTIGADMLEYFRNIDKNRLIVRVLAVKESLEKCNLLHIPTHNIIAAKGRFSVDTNEALFKEYNIKHLVTKDSGLEGGMHEKIEAAIYSRVNVHVLERPVVYYPEVTDNFENLYSTIEAMEV